MGSGVGVGSGGSVASGVGETTGAGVGIGCADAVVTMTAGAGTQEASSTAASRHISLNKLFVRICATSSLQPYFTVLQLTAVFEYVISNADIQYA